MPSFSNSSSRADHLRIVDRITQAASAMMEFRIAGINRAQSIDSSQTVPASTSPPCARPSCAADEYAHFSQKCISGRATRKKFRHETTFRRPFQMQMPAMSRPPTKSSSMHISAGNFLQRLLGIANGQRNQNGARPRRDFVDVEPEPVRESMISGGIAGTAS